MRHHKINIITILCLWAKHLNSLNINIFIYKIMVIWPHKTATIKTLRYYKNILEIVKREKLRMIPMFLPGLLVYDGAFYCNRDTKQEAGWREQMMSSILGMMNWKLKLL